jgi:3-dehydroquinate synthase
LVEASLRSRGLRCIHLSAPSGEEAKSLAVFGTLLHQLATQEAHRDDLVVSVGGGATGDVAGFVASTYMRGVRFLQVPTTLTAQVDAAIGGKTAVNLPEGKNLVGTFFQPIQVWCDVDALSTLGDRDFRSGLAEVVKYGLIGDEDLVTQFETDPGPILRRDGDALASLVARCVAHKAAAVAADERDLGRRLILNYGHTLGHALERLDAFAGRSHGEAIAIGMDFAARLAERRGICQPGLVSRTASLLATIGLEANGALPPVRDILVAVRMDKKFHGGVRFVLLEGVGAPIVVDDVPGAEIAGVLEEMGAVA